jgi:hypothetical protein
LPTAKTAPPSINVQALADKAVFGICELLGLLLGLPFGDDLYHNDPISGWHWFYLVIGLFFAGIGPMFPWIRTRTWIPEWVSTSLSWAALDARIWIGAVFLLFLYGTGPELYQANAVVIACSFMLARQNTDFVAVFCTAMLPSPKV